MKLLNSMILIIISIFSINTLFSQNAQDLFISEYMEGATVSGTSWGSTKYLEIFNGTGQDVDLSQYNIRLGANGATFTTVPGTNYLELSGTLPNNSVYIIAHSSSVQEVKDKANLLVNGGIVNFNGDDAVGLFKGNTLIDIIGKEGIDPGSSWFVLSESTADNILVRKSKITKGNVIFDRDTPGGSNTYFENTSEWLVVGEANVSELGRHNFLDTIRPTGERVFYFQDLADVNVGSGSLFPFQHYLAQGTIGWFPQNRFGSIYAQCSNFAGSGPSESWLISEPIDTRRIVTPYFEFDWVNHNFNNPNTNSKLETYVSTDYIGTGNPNDFTWTKLTDGILDQRNDFDFLNSNKIDLSAYKSDAVYLAFVYKSPESGSLAKQAQIDNIMVYGQEVANTAPTQLRISKVNPTEPTSNLDFTLKIETANNANVPMPTSNDVDFVITLTSGSGVLTGELTGTIVAGTYETIVNLKYNKAETININVKDSHQGGLFGFTKTDIKVNQGPDQLVITDYYSKGHVGSDLPTLTVEAQFEDGTLTNSFSNFQVELMAYDFQNNLINTFTSVFVNGVAVFNNINFEFAGSYNLKAKVSSLISNEVLVEILDIPNFSELIVPRYMIGNDGDGNFGGRLPSYALVELSGLHPNTEYRYLSAGTNTDYSQNDAGLQTATLYGSMIFYDENNNEFWHNGNRSLTAVDGVCDAVTGFRTRGYSTFTSDYNGNKKIWMTMYPSSNSRFDVNTSTNNIQWVFTLGNEMGKQIKNYQTTTQSQTKILTNTTGREAVSATGIVDMTSLLNPTDVVVLYTNSPTNGYIPVSTAIVQGDGSMMQSWGSSPDVDCNIANWFTHQGAPFFRDIDGYITLEDEFVTPSPEKGRFDEVSGAWAAFLPNQITYPGSQLIEDSKLDAVAVYDIYGNFKAEYIVTNGVWKGINTNNPNGGLNPIGFETPGLNLTAPTFSEYCNQSTDFLEITWETNGLEKVDIGYYVWDGNNWNYNLIENNVDAVFDVNQPGIGSYEWFVPRDLLSEKSIYIEIANFDFGIAAESNVFQVFDAPEFESETQSEVTCEGQTVIFGVNALGSNVNYQWYKDGKEIEGQTTNGLTLANVKHTTSGVYNCRVWNENSSVCGDVYTEDMVLYVARKTEITWEPTTTGAVLGGVATLSFDAHSNGLPPSYRIGIQWYKGNTLLVDNDRISGSNTNLLVIKDINSSDFSTTADYYAVATGLCGSATTAKVSIIQADVTIDEQPTSQEVCAGSDFNLSIKVTSNIQGQLSYQWKRNGIKLADNSKIIGSKSANLTVMGADISVDGDYTCEVFVASQGITFTSNIANISIKANTTITKNLETEVTGKVATALTLTVEATGVDLSYQWYKNNGILTNQTTNTLTISSLVLADAGVYHCVVNGDCGVVNSNIANLTVTNSGINLSVVETSKSGFAIYSPYPNPVSDKTSFEIKMPKAGRVNIKLLSPTGQEISIFENKIFGLGNHKVELDVEALNLTNGMYFIIFENEESLLKQKMIINN